MRQQNKYHAWKKTEMLQRCATKATFRRYCRNMSMYKAMEGDPYLHT